MKIWNKPWSFAEGFVIGGGLIASGVVLEMSVGPVAWDAFAWPVNAIVLAAFLMIIAAIHIFRKRVYVFRFLSTYHAAIPALVYAVALTIIMGLTRQSADGTWLNNMLSFWPFVLIYTYIALILGLVVIRQMTHIKFSVLNFQFSLFFHLGLFIAMTTATLGNADMQRLRMITVEGESEHRAINEQGMLQELPLTIELKKFIMEQFDDGSPKRFASEIKITTKAGKNIQTTVDVNKPVEVDGWKIYQYGYDTEMGARRTVSILELVSDPWLPVVYTGIYMMLFGAMLMFFKGGKGGER